MNTRQKKKQPELLREKVLEAAASLVLEKGLAGLTLDAAARLAGVSKGGLIHHFSSKAELIIALFEYVLTGYEKEIFRVMEDDNEGGARFSRAYVRTIAWQEAQKENLRVLGLLSLIMSTESTLAGRWQSWLAQCLKKFGENPDLLQGKLVRYAADGMWLEICSGQTAMSASRQEIVNKLIAMTLPDKTGIKK